MADKKGSQLPVIEPTGQDKLLAVDYEDSQSATIRVQDLAKGMPLATDDDAGPVVLADNGEAAVGKVVQGNDSRLSDARTPTAHAATHSAGGSDVITPADIGAATAVDFATHEARTDNPHLVTAEQVGALFLCEFYFFRHPTLRPGFQPAQGGLIANAATLYPEAWAYLQTTEGQLLCKSEAEWQAMTTAIWHTNVDESEVGWNGIGGAPFFVQDLAAGTLRLPDIRGMYAEAAGYDSLGVGGVHGDAIRRISGRFGGHLHIAQSNGAFQRDTLAEGWTRGSAEQAYHDARFESDRVVPAAAKNQPRAWGALACVYLGRPAS